MLHLRQFRSTARGFPDLLNYAALVGDGVVLCKDGALLAGFLYEGHDPQTLSVAEREGLAARFNAALVRLGSGYATWIEAVRMPAPGYSPRELSSFPDPVTQLIDEERRARFETEGARFETQHALFIQYLPPPAAAARLGDLVLGGAVAREGSRLDRHLEAFAKALDDFEDRFLGAVRACRRMRGFVSRPADGAGPMERQDELVNALQKMITGDWDAVLNIPSPAMFMDGWIAGADFYPGSPCRMGGRYIRCVALDGFPAASFPGILDVLDGLGLPYRWSNRFVHLDAHDAAAVLDRYRAKWRQKQRGVVSLVFNTPSVKVDLDAGAMEQEAAEAVAAANDGRLGWGYYSAVVVLMHEDHEVLEDRARQLAQIIGQRGFSSRIETWNTAEAYLGSLPGHMFANVRRPLIHTGNLADLSPIATAWPGLPFNPSDRFPQPSRPLLHCVSTGATDFALNLHVGDVGHHLVFGPTGSGKSTLLCSVAAAFRAYEGATVAVIDRGGSAMALCRAVGGAHYDLGRDDSPGLCPLEHLDSEEDLAWAEDWIAVCVQLQAGQPPTLGQRDDVRRALRSLRGSRHRRSLTAFVSSVNDPEVRAALNNYAIDGKFGGMVDAEAGEVEVSGFTVFEVEALLERGDEITVPVLLLLFRMVERRLQGQPALLLVDEAWSALAHPASREKIGEWLRTLRKRNAAVGLYTQSLADVADSEISGLLRDNCPTKIFLANPEARNRPGVYERFGLRPGAIDTIAGAVPRREYYYHSQLGERLFSLALGPIALSFVAASSAEDQAQVRELIAREGGAWPWAWLRRRGVAFEHLRETAP